MGGRHGDLRRFCRSDGAVLAHGEPRTRRRRRRVGSGAGPRRSALVARLRAAVVPARSGPGSLLWGLPECGGVLIDGDTMVAVGQGARRRQGRRRLDAGLADRAAAAAPDRRSAGRVISARCRECASRRSRGTAGRRCSRSDHGTPSAVSRTAGPRRCIGCRRSATPPLPTS